MSYQLDNPHNIEWGEIALKINKGDEAIAIKNRPGEIVYLPFNVDERTTENASNIEVISGDVISMQSDINYLIEKTFTFNFSVGMTTSLMEEGHTGTTNVTFSVTGDVDRSGCRYVMYVKRPGRPDYVLYKTSFDETEISTGRVSVQITNTTGITYFMIVATTLDKIAISKSGTTSCSHAYKTLFGPTTDYPITIDTLSHLNGVLVAKGDYRMNFGGPYYSSLLIIAAPKNYGHVRSIKDDNKFEYINGYTENDEISENYYVYIKNEPVTNTASSYYLTISY